MLDKILGVLAMVACMLLCSASWLYQDVMARRAREEQEEVENQAAAAQDDDAENNPNRERKKRRVEFPSEVTMVLEVDHFLIDSQTEHATTNDKAEVPRKETTEKELEKLDYSLGHQSDRCTGARILVPVPGRPARTEDQHLKSQQPSTRVVSCECAICLNAYAPEDTIVWSKNTKCPHVFHLDCIKKWSKKTEEEVSCPCCRQVFLDHEDENDAKENEHIDLSVVSANAAGAGETDADDRV